MSKIVVFCEDAAHEAVLKAIIGKLKPDWVQVQILTSRQGKGKVISELKIYFQQLAKNMIVVPDAIVVATDANCMGYNQKRKEIEKLIPETLESLPIAFAIPDPHIERWLMIDSHAFKEVFGKGCNLPDHKCERNRYKTLLKEQIRQTGTTPLLGGTEYAENLICFMDFTSNNLKNLDESFARFIDELKNLFKAIHQK